ncbi:MAG: SusC/RagA family TonB-linked outer membrane protein, partial [Tidjanibacter sp.]|nr:SusC/RagA family TonB-linked outer membrane protein [Tidjanibacter sp.]
GTMRKTNSISSRYLEDGSFFRLRNVTLAYDVPASVCKRVGMSGARVFLSADNLLTLSKFSGMDPEVNLETSGSTLAGTYAENYPVPMTVSLGVDVKF